MSKATLRCVDCGKPYYKRQPRCFCGGDLVEEQPEGTNQREFFNVDETEVIRLAEAPDLTRRRHDTGYSEFNRVLGGGLAETQVVLLAGLGGAGKTTLVHGALANLQRHGVETLYVSGEEAAVAAKSRAERMGGSALDIPFMATTNIRQALKEADERDVRVLFLDSLSVMRDDRIDGPPGKPRQQEAVINLVISFAKYRGIGVILNAHATRAKDFATMENIIHLVDTPLFMEIVDGVRILRCRGKNRFGNDLEVGYFEMTSRGLMEVENPSHLFLGQHGRPTIGAATGGFGEGPRPVLVETQALVNPTTYPSPQRNAVGIPPKRLSMQLAILEKHAGLDFSVHDVFVSLTGGLKVREPVLDAATLVAIGSSHIGKPPPEGSLFLGEVTLDGSARSARGIDRVVREAGRIGFTQIYLPQSTRLDPEITRDAIVEYESVNDLLKKVFGSREDLSREDHPARSVPVTVHQS